MNLFTNILIYKETFKVSNETQKIVLGFIKPYILKALYNIEKDINNNEFKIQINGFNTTTIDGKNKQQINSELNNYVNTYFPDNDNKTIIPLIIINIIGIIGLFVTLNNKTLSTILIIVLVLGNILLFAKLNKSVKIRNEAKHKLKNEITLNIERALAETIDYKTMQEDDNKKRDELMLFLDNIKPENFIKSNNERNIDVGE